MRQSKFGVTCFRTPKITSVGGGFCGRQQDDGCDRGPEVFAGASHLQPDPLPCGWGPPGALDQDLGQPAIEGREGLDRLNAGIWSRMIQQDEKVYGGDN